MERLVQESVCKFCGIGLNEVNWYPSNRRLNYKVCITCAKKLSHQYYSENKEKRKEYEKKRRQDPIRKKRLREWQKQYRLRHPERIKAYRATYKARHRDRSFKFVLKKNYGLTLEQYNQMVEKVGGKCEICGKIPKRRLTVDHNHQTGKIRGLLCVNCNAGLGSFRDSIQNLADAIVYLKSRDFHLFGMA